MSEFVTVDIPQGRLRGKRVTSSSNGVTYYSFQGIPYAKPPVGPLRFKPPEDPESWTGTRDATVEGAVAPQIDLFSKVHVGEEDCLFLNVYAPEWPVKSPKAVMIWIHGGGFLMGSGNTDVHGPEFLVAEDVVVVTINYRLGALGFLYLEGTDITGNNGLRDQVMALKWVQNNIALFGGDSGNVTIFGCSAGGASVHYLMLSPLAKGLFHRAIAQSGTALMSSCDISPDVSKQWALRLAELLGCDSNEHQQVADFLRTVPAEKFIAAQFQVPSQEEEHRVLLAQFFPSEEIGPEAFLPASPRKLLREGKFIKVPLIIGVTSAEGKIMLADLDEIYSPEKLSDMDQHFERVLPTNLAPEISSERSKEIANIIRRFYFGEKHLDEETITQYIDLISDLMFVYPMHQTAQSLNSWSPYPTYMYLFDHKSAPGVGVYPVTLEHLPGTIHAAEIPYLFQSSLKPSNFSHDSPDYEVFSKLAKLWTQFSKTGTPTCDDISWTPAAKGKLNYLSINGGFKMNCDMFKQRLDFLDDLYSKYGLGIHVD